MHLTTTFAATAAARPTPLPAPDSPMERLASTQARFRIEGDGPIASRTITPVTPAASELFANDPGISRTIRGVMRLVQDTAGGPEASSNVEFNGISFATSKAGLVANTWRADLDDDEGLIGRLREARPEVRREAMDLLAARHSKQVPGQRANVISGWMNLGPATSATLTASPWSRPSVRTTAGERAAAIRTLLHESAHVIDGEPANLPGPAMHGVWEALVESRSTSLPQLQRARTVLGWDATVSDALLSSAALHRPYVQAERVLERVLQTAGVAPGSEQARELTSGSGAQVVDRLTAKLASATGESTTNARTAIAETFAASMAATHG